MKDNRAIFFLLIFVFMLHAGTIRKQEDPILKTQTDPILHKQKMEEIKDGEKGAPAPTWKLYPKEKFLAEPPVEDGKDEKAPTDPNKIPAPGEPIPENLEDTDQVALPSDLEREVSESPSDDEKENEDQDWWEGEESEDNHAAVPGEDVEFLNGVKKADQKAETHGDRPAAGRI